MTGRLALGAAATLLLAGCHTAPKPLPPRPDPAHIAMLARVRAFLPQAEAEAAQCRYFPDRKMLDTYLGGLRTLQMSPAGGAELAAQTIRWFEETSRHCRQQMEGDGRR